MGDLNGKTAGPFLSSYCPIPNGSAECCRDPSGLKRHSFGFKPPPLLPRPNLSGLTNTTGKKVPTGVQHHVRKHTKCKVNKSRNKRTCQKFFGEKFLSDAASFARGITVVDRRSPEANRLIPGRDLTFAQFHDRLPADAIAAGVTAGGPTSAALPYIVVGGNFAVPGRTWNPE